MSKIAFYRNLETGELAPPHVIGTDENGLKLYQYVEGWEPVDWNKHRVECEIDEDGNWISD